MGKLTKRLVWLLLAFVVGLAGNLIAAWIQNDVLQNLFTPRRLAVTGLLVILVLILLAWKESRDEAARPDDKRDLTREQRNRAAMLTTVRNFWVMGVLEKSLHGAALIELGKEYKPDAVHYPWTSVLQRPDHLDKSLPSETKTVEVFEAVGGELLILGEPGSGKTTMLLDLARDLITRAERDEKLPIPVVFILSSWAEKRPLLADWLAEELNLRYDVPKKIAAAWVRDDAVLPLLDGLDEVKPEHREACVETINRFRQDHGLFPTVVCSRSKEYEALNVQLRLQDAILLKPLARDQIEGYLTDARGQLGAVRALLRHDQSLQELAESPLMLDVMVLAYRGLSVNDLKVMDTVEKRRKHLFDTYVQRMFERRGSDERYAPPQVIHWLSWLARRLVEHNQTAFYLEGIQPSWLENRSQRRFYEMAIRLFVGLGFGLVFGLISISEGALGLAAGLIAGVGIGVALGLSLGLKEVRIIETLQWSWSQAKLGLVIGLIGGLGGGLVSGLVVGLVSGPGSGLVLGLGCGMYVVLFGGLIFGMLLGLRGGKERESKIMPNQGIWRSVRNAVVGGLIVGLIIGLAYALLGAWVFRPSPIVWFRAWLTIALIFGLLVSLNYGSLAYLQHITLYLLLWRNGDIPPDYVHFLDYCAERIFLRKIGGGYIFVHRLLMEYFAELGD